MHLNLPSLKKGETALLLSLLAISRCRFQFPIRLENSPRLFTHRCQATEKTTPFKKKHWKNHLFTPVKTSFSRLPICVQIWFKFHHLFLKGGLLPLMSIYFLLNNELRFRFLFQKNIAIDFACYINTLCYRVSFIWNIGTGFEGKLVRCRCFNKNQLRFAFFDHLTNWQIWMNWISFHCNFFLRNLTTLLLFVTLWLCSIFSWWQ